MIIFCKGSAGLSSTLQLDYRPVRHSASVWPKTGFNGLYRRSLIFLNALSKQPTVSGGVPISRGLLDESKGRCGLFSFWSNCDSCCHFYHHCINLLTVTGRYVLFGFRTASGRYDLFYTALFGQYVHSRKALSGFARYIPAF